MIPKSSESQLLWEEERGWVQKSQKWLEKNSTARKARFAEHVFCDLLYSASPSLARRAVLGELTLGESTFCL